MIFKNGEIESVIQAFFIKKEDDVTVIILLGNKHYEITTNSKESPIQRDYENENYSVSKDKRLKICSNTNKKTISNIPQVFP